MKNIKIDFITNTIVVTKGFYEAATEYGTQEYAELQNVKAANPNMTISVRTVNRGHNKNCNKGLTYRYMRKFISIMDSGNLKTFEDTMLYYESLHTENAVVYQAVKNWFLDIYPNHRDMVVSHAPAVKTNKINSPTFNSVTAA